jgi:uncharacterized CHY-type Zn-finger protein
MIWDKKYKPEEHEIICPICKKNMEKNEWEDFGMHYECTEYFKMKKYFEKELIKKIEKKDVTKTMINEI